MNLVKGISSFSLAATATLSLAFDTGHHSDLTRDALSDFGMSDASIKVCQVENWLVDYYSNQEVGVDDHIIHDCEKLHADNLFTAQAVSNYWRRLAYNSKLAFESAARSKNPRKVLALLGMGLHIVQDFYTHSNWAELKKAPRAFDYATTTFFDAPSIQGVFTGKYGNPLNSADLPEHGGYSHGVNHDSYVRPNWDKAYVFAYSASCQWINQAKQWVSAIDSGTWDKARQIGLTGAELRQLDSDLDASYKISLWVKNGPHNGHWKGSGSGDLASFGAFSAKWVPLTRDSVFVKDIKERNWQKLLSGGLEGSLDLGLDKPAPQNVSIAKFALNKRAILVRTLNIEDLSRQDWPLDEADMFAKITVAGQAFIEATQQNKKKTPTSWTTIKFVDDSAPSIKVSYELWDEDSFSSDPMDVNNQKGLKNLDLTFNVSTRKLSGLGILTGVYDSAANVLTTSGNPGAKITLWVTTRKLARSPL